MTEGGPDASHGADRRVVVTGIGLVTPLGPDRESSWRGLLAGNVAVRRLRADRGGRLVPAEDGNFVGAPVAPAEERSPEPVVDLALRAAEEAYRDADLGGVDPATVGCVIGTSKGGLHTARRIQRDGTGDWSLVPPDAPGRAVAAVYRTGGPLLCPVAACATGLAAIIRGAELIRDGDCRAVLAGSSDASLIDGVVSSFRRLRVHARPDPEDPGRSCRPFDRERTGFVVGEGAAVLVLESAESAAARGAIPYAEWLGGRVLGDAAGLTVLDESGAVPTRAIRDTLASAGKDRFDVVQLHGTGTGPNDRCETRALVHVLGESARTVPGFAVKGAIGHLLGAAGSVETAFTLLAMRDGVVPPSANRFHPDPDADLNLATEPRPQPIATALKLSLGFGGHVAVGLLGRPPTTE